MSSEHNPVTSNSEGEKKNAVDVEDDVDTKEHITPGAAALGKEPAAIVESDDEEEDHKPPPDPEFFRRALEAMRAAAKREVHVPVGEDDGKDGKYGNKEPLAVNDEGNNKYKIICPFCCKSLILRANVAKYVVKSIYLPYPSSKTAAEGEIYTDFFQVRKQMDFENVAVKRGHGECAEFQYLTCADCDGGPIGIVYKRNGKPVEFFIAHKRIRYEHD